MANLKSSRKDIKRIAKRTERNKRLKSRLKTLRKSVDNATAAADSSEARNAAVAYISSLDKGAKVGLIHRNKVSREKSKLAKFLVAS